MASEDQQTWLIPVLQKTALVTESHTSYYILDWLVLLQRDYQNLWYLSTELRKLDKKLDRHQHLLNKNAFL